MRRFLFVLLGLLAYGGLLNAQENPRYDLIHVHLDEPMTQHEFAMTYNICWEYVHQHLLHRVTSPIPAMDLYFPPDTLPCYNEAGQRLIFFEDGKSLVEPYYTDMRVYVTTAHETIKSLTQAVNVCYEKIIKQNEHIFPYEYPYYGGGNNTSRVYDFDAGQEIFIPDAPPCYDDDGRLLAYVDDEVIPLEGRVHILARGLSNISLEHNICPEDLLAANLLEDWSERRSSHFVIPNHQPCYDIYRANEFTVGELAFQLGLCADDIQRYNSGQGSYYYVRRDANLCDPPPSEPTTTATPMIVVSMPTPTARPPLPTSIFTQTPTPNISVPIISFEPNPNVTVLPIATAAVPMPTFVPLSVQPRLPIPVDGRIILPDFTQFTILSYYYNVCAPALATANDTERGFPNGKGAEVIIPNTRPCYDDNGNKLIYPADSGTPIPSEQEVIIITSDSYRLINLAWQYDICFDDLLAANTHIELSIDFNNLQWTIGITSLSAPFGSEIFIPNDTQSCFTTFKVEEHDIAELAQEFNVCVELLQKWQYRIDRIPHYMIPSEYPPCYDENGHRLRFYEIDRQRKLLSEPVRSSLDVYVVPYHMSYYELARTVNVCLDVLRAHNHQVAYVPRANEEVFVPNTRPCYDELTGRPLIYEDEFGQPLTQPIVADELTHLVQFGHTWNSIAGYYNICTDRLKKYNEDFLPNVWTVNHWGQDERIAHGKGIFEVGVYVRIPQDRPPCFDYGEAQHIRYVCYDMPIDMTQDNPDALINPDGTHCYDIEDPETVIWHDGDHYLYQFREGLYMNDFMQWCFGVEADDIIATSDNPIVYIIPYDELLIRNPTRTCYIREDDGAEHVHWVEEGETLRDIGWRYGKLTLWLADANDLPDGDLIWAGQRLVIPEGVNLWHVASGLGGVLMLLPIIGYLFRRQQGTAGRKRKRKAKGA